MWTVNKAIWSPVKNENKYQQTLPCGPNPVRHLYKVIEVQSSPYIHMLSAATSVTVTQTNSCNSDFTSCKSKNIYYLCLDRVCQPWPEASPVLMMSYIPPRSHDNLPPLLRGNCYSQFGCSIILFIEREKFEHIVIYSILHSFACLFKGNFLLKDTEKCRNLKFAAWGMFPKWK